MKNIFILIFIISSCQNKKENILTNTPLESVINLNSAEELKNFNEALKYIDVKRVYTK